MSYTDRIKETKMSWLGLAEDYALNDSIDWIGMKEERSISVSVPVVLGFLFFLTVLILD